MQHPPRSGRSWLLASIAGVLLAALGFAAWIAFASEPDSDLATNRELTPDASRSPNGVPVASVMEAPQDPVAEPPLVEPELTGRQAIVRARGELVPVEILVRQKSDQTPLAGCELLY